MPRIVITENSAEGLERCRRFLAEKNPHAVTRAAEVIMRSLALLETEPQIGRPLNNLPELRELIIPFGASGYVALYQHEVKTDSVYVLAFRHQKEVGF